MSSLGLLFMVGVSGLALLSSGPTNEMQRERRENPAPVCCKAGGCWLGVGVLKDW